MRRIKAESEEHGLKHWKTMKREDESVNGGGKAVYRNEISLETKYR